jgi:hypothetical protein
MGQVIQPILIMANGQNFACLLTAGSGSAAEAVQTSHATLPF